MDKKNRRDAMKAASAATAALAMGSTGIQCGVAAPPSEVASATTDSKPMQLYKSLSDEQRAKICLPSDHVKRQFISNWWYVHRSHRINNTFDRDQVALIQEIFDSMHSEEHQAAVNKQVRMDQYGAEKNSPSVGFFGSPADGDFEFIYTGHHVTRRCNAHSDSGSGFGGAPIFYGHFPEDFHETKDHPGNPYWYQGKIFNEFVQALDSKQQAVALDDSSPRSEKPNSVIEMKSEGWPGLSCRDLSDDQKSLFVSTMKRMMAMFREQDVEATFKTIDEKKIVDDLYISYYGGRYDIGNDKVWDTWQIEGPNLVWYFRGEPHIHSYFHLKS